MEKVAWPGAQPSLVREGGGPIAQVPQQVEDASSEAIVPEPFVYEANEAGGTQTRQNTATAKMPLYAKFLKDMLSYPNFVGGPSVVRMRPSFDHFEVFDTHR